MAGSVAAAAASALVAAASRIAGRSPLERRKFRLARSLLVLRDETFRLTGRPHRRCRFLGHDLEFRDFDELRRLADEIFGRRVYAFAARGPSPFIIDGGANIGMSVLFFRALYPEARILAFEPDAAAVDCLRRNLAANRIEGVDVRAEALLDRDGEVTLYGESGPGRGLLSSVYPERLGAPRAATVAATRLSPHIDREVDLLKLDVEGAEDAVLADLEASGALARIHQMHIEYHHHLRTHEDRLGGFLARLERSGFGYRLAAAARDGTPPWAFQDVMIHAYRPPA